MKRLLLPIIVWTGIAAAVPAAAQDPVPLPPFEGVDGASESTAAPEGVVPDSAVLAGKADERRACKHVIAIEGIPHSWDQLERGTDEAWKAYSKGEYPSSVPVFERLASIGHPVAEWLMGNVYFFGQGVPLDYRSALIWFEKAALQGCFAAYAPTAKLYEQGSGTGVDLGKAYMWYNIAVAQLAQGKERLEMVELREKVADQMTPAQIEAAQKRSLQFVPRPVVPPDLSELPEGFFSQPQ